MPLYMPELYEERATRQMTSVFGGLNRGARIPDGEWADMQNLTSDQYPLMATRDKRYHSDNRCCPTAVTVRSYRVPVPLDGTKLKFGDGREVDLSEYGLSKEDALKQKLLVFEPYVIVDPAMIYINTADIEDAGRMEEISTDENEGEVWLDGTTLKFVDGREVGLWRYALTVGAAPKQKLLNLGAYVIVHPAMIYVNTADIEDAGRIMDVLLGEYEGVVWLDGVTLRFGGRHAVNLSTYGLKEYDAHKQKLLNFGAYVIVYPAMIYVNTVDVEDAGRIEDVVELTSNENGSIKHGVRISPANYEMERASFVGGEPPDTSDEVATGPVRLREGSLWYNTKVQYHGSTLLDIGLYVYSEDGEEKNWTKEKEYIKIEFYERRNDADVPTYESISFDRRLAPGDIIKIAGIQDALEVSGLTTTALRDANYVVQNVKQVQSTLEVEAFCIEGKWPATLERTVFLADVTPGEKISFSRPIPRMDYMCESDNRLWGCRYGDDGHGNFVNEIYCSARGDFFRWIQGAADNDDSPVTFSIGTDGPWTGCVNYGGAPTFFKERCMHRVGGYGASGFYVQDTPVRGVMSGASDSLAVVNGVLYYYADGAVMGFDGSLPVPVSEKLSPLWKYKRAVGGALYGKYYLSLYDESSTMINDDKGGKKRKPPSECALYVLDTDRGLWHKEDDVEITRMATGEDDLVFVKVGEETVKSDSGVSYRRLIHMLGSIRGTANLMPDRGQDASEEVYDWSPDAADSIQWSATSGIIGLETPDKKYLSKISIRLHLGENAWASVWVEYDSEGTWKPVGNVPQTNRMRTVILPIIPKRCDHMRLKLEGTGTCKVYSITKTFTEAEDE